MTDIEREEWNERAAILEFEAGYPRPLAERMAKRMIITSRTLRELRDIGDTSW